MRVKNNLAGYVPVRYYSSMKTYTQQDFERWGREGGIKRKEKLSPARRKAIAKKAGSTKRKPKK